MPVKKYPDKETAYYTRSVVMSKSKVMNSRGEVPWKQNARFVADGKNSTIYIPVDFKFSTKTYYYKAKEWTDIVG